jgi:hypothetical protein
MDDAWKAADEMIDLFGADASLRAALRADAALDEGESRSFNFWKAVEAALRPRDGELRQ